MKLSKSLITRLLFLLILAILMVVMACNYTCEHLEKDNNCLCLSCGQPEHLWDENHFGFCTKCRIFCSHSIKDKNCVCKDCGHICHIWVKHNSKDTFQCSSCKTELDSTSVAYELLALEEKYWNNFEQHCLKNPNYQFFFYPISSVLCTFALTDDLLADDFIEKHKLREVIPEAQINALNSIKMVNIHLSRDEYTQDVCDLLKEISSKDASVKNLFVEMYSNGYESYVPKIEAVDKNATKISYTEIKPLIEVQQAPSFIIKSTQDYNQYIDYLCDNVSWFMEESFNRLLGLYDDAFFQENALVITRQVVRSSGSIKLTTNNLYISGNKLYVVIRTDHPGGGTCDMQYKTFTYIVPQSEIANATEVVVLD